MSHPDFEASIARLTRRVDAALAQSERFDRLAEEVWEWAESWPVEAIARWLDEDEPATPQAERAMVALALKGSDDSGARLRDYDASAGGQRHELLWQVALIEWERRHHADLYEGVA